MIKPTVGRKVWYRPSGYDNNSMIHDQKQPLDATIVCVHSDTLINAVVFDHNGKQHVKTSVKLLQEGEDAPVGGGYCEWMPYQTGQAKKTEQAESVAEAARRGFKS